MIHGSYSCSERVSQFALILLCSQLILCQKITVREFPELLSSNETQSRERGANDRNQFKNELRIKRGVHMSTIPVGDVTDILRNYPVGTQDVSTGGKQPRENQWNLFELEYDNSYQVPKFLLKLVGEQFYSTIKKKDDNMIDGYWLATAKYEEENVRDASGKTKLKNNVLRVPNNEATKFIFTAELQGCSVYVKVNPDSVDFYHYNRPALHSIYVNEYKESKISQISNNFLNVHGDGIKFNGDSRLNPKKLFSRTGEIRHVGGVIVLSEPLFIRDEDNGEKIEIITIDGKKVDSLIRLNSIQVNHETALKEKYDVAIRWENYIGLPANYVLLMNREKIKRSFVTGHFYRKNPVSPWHFYSQRITYFGTKEDGNNEKKMFNNANPFKFDIEIKKK